MKSLKINWLLIFNTNEATAKKVQFTDGFNIVTSNLNDGSKKGKSVILKSIYHSLGADCFFDQNFNENSISFLISMNIGKLEYIVYRYDKLFKIFHNDKLVNKTTNRIELSLILSKIFSFGAMLPKRGNQELELTPPAYNYLLNYIDSDHQTGSKFDSFKNLGQYSNFKVDLLNYHFGIFDDEYYRLSNYLVQLKDKLDTLTSNVKMLDNMVGIIEKNSNGVLYEETVINLRKEIERSKEKYQRFANQLSKTRNSLIILRNSKVDYEHNISELMKISKDNQSKINYFNHKLCPECKQEIDGENSIDSKMDKYLKIENIDYLVQTYKIQIDSLSIQIKTNEEKYSKELKQLESFKFEITKGSSEIEEVMKHMGLIEAKKLFMNDRETSESEVRIINDEVSELSKQLKIYNDNRKIIEDDFVFSLIEEKNKLGLNEIISKNITGFNSEFLATGSNKPVSTVVWYLNLLKIKNKHNSNAIRFPLVIDSPANSEIEVLQREELINYIYDNHDIAPQVIISILGVEKPKNKEFEVNIINLENEKYKLLSNEDYLRERDLISKFAFLDS